MIGTRVGNYEIKQKLGEGGMGAVYMGEHPLIGKRVAIKVLLDELTANEALVTRFFHEAKAANDIRHQNIVDIVDFGKIEKPGGGNIVYLVMELVEARSVQALLDSGPVSWREATAIMIVVAANAISRDNVSKDRHRLRSSKRNHVPTTLIRQSLSSRR